MLQNFQEMKVNMSLKIHTLPSHLNFFSGNLGAVSDDHGEGFHQDIAEIEKGYQGNWCFNALAEYCLSVMTDENKCSLLSSMQVKKSLASSSSFFWSGEKENVFTHVVWASSETIPTKLKILLLSHQPMTPELC